MKTHTRYNVGNQALLAYALLTGYGGAEFIEADRLMLIKELSHKASRARPCPVKDPRRYFPRQTRRRRTNRNPKKQPKYTYLQDDRFLYEIEDSPKNKRRSPIIKRVTEVPGYRRPKRRD